MPVLPVLFKLQTLQGRGLNHVRSIVININPCDLQTARLLEAGMTLMQNTEGLAQCFVSPGDGLTRLNACLDLSHRCDQSKEQSFPCDSPRLIP